MPTPSFTPEPVSISEFTNNIVFIAIGIVAFVVVLFIISMLIGKKVKNE